MANSDLVQSVVRALDIMKLVAASSRGMRLNEIAAAAELNKTTAFNLIRTLMARGLLEKDAENRFLSGPGLEEMAARRQQSGIFRQAGTWLTELSRRYPAAIFTFAELTPGAVNVRLRMSPDRPGELQQPLGRTCPAYTSVTALCLQATGSNAELFEEHYSFPEYGSPRWGAREHFLRYKQETARNGFCALVEPQHLRAAFVAADNFAIGASLDGTPANGWEAVLARLADECRCLVQRGRLSDPGETP